MEFVRAPIEASQIILPSHPLGVAVAKNHIGPVAAVVVIGIRVITVHAPGFAGDQIVATNDPDV